MLEVDGNLSFVYNIIPLYTLCAISYFIQNQRQYFVLTTLWKENVNVPKGKWSKR